MIEKVIIEVTRESMEEFSEGRDYESITLTPEDMTALDNDEMIAVHIPRNVSVVFIVGLVKEKRS